MKSFLKLIGVFVVFAGLGIYLQNSEAIHGSVLPSCSDTTSSLCHFDVDTQIAPTPSTVPAKRPQLTFGSEYSLSANANTAVREDKINGCKAGHYIVNSTVGLASQGYSQKDTITVISNDLAAGGWVMTGSANLLVSQSVKLGFKMYESGMSSTDAANAFLQNCMNNIDS